MPVLCRDCLSGASAAGATGRAACGSVRLVVHDEFERWTIEHLDCDAIHAAVEKRDNPALADKPVVDRSYVRDPMSGNSAPKDLRPGSFRNAPRSASA